MASSMLEIKVLSLFHELGFPIRYLPGGVFEGARILKYGYVGHLYFPYYIYGGEDLKKRLPPGVKVEPLSPIETETLNVTTSLLRMRSTLPEEEKRKRFCNYQAFNQLPQPLFPFNSLSAIFVSVRGEPIDTRLAYPLIFVPPPLLDYKSYEIPERKFKEVADMIKEGKDLVI